MTERRAARPEPRLSRRQSAVLDTLVDLFLARGFRDLGLDDITSAARCSKSTLYALADSKEQLVVRCVEHYFRRAAERIEVEVARHRSPTTRLQAFLLAVAHELDAASDAFLADVAAHDLTRRSYERHTRIAADRVREIVSAGIAAGEFDAVHARFLGEVTAAAMDAIERGGITERTGLTHSAAYAELAKLTLATLGVTRERGGRGAGRARRSAD
jgi:AcrR family transcriptional regulator